MRPKTLPLLLLLVPGLVLAATPAQPGATPVVIPATRHAAGEVDLLEERPDGVKVRWTAALGDGRRSLRLALPPQSHAVLAAPEADSPTATAGGAAIRLTEMGWMRRLPFVDVVLDADALPPGPASERMIDVRFVAGAPSPKLPPAVLDDEHLFEGIARVAGASSAIVVPVVPSSRGAASAPISPRETELLRLAGFANASSAPEFLARSLADASSRPPLLRHR